MKSLRNYLDGPPPRVSYDPSQEGRILKKVGWSRQKPQAKAPQQNPVQWHKGAKIAYHIGGPAEFKKS